MHLKMLGSWTWNPVVLMMPVGSAIASIHLEKQLTIRH